MTFTDYAKIDEQIQRGESLPVRWPIMGELGLSREETFRARMRERLMPDEVYDMVFRWDKGFKALYLGSREVWGRQVENFAKWAENEADTLAQLSFYQKTIIAVTQNNVVFEDNFIGGATVFLRPNDQGYDNLAKKLNKHPEIPKGTNRGIRQVDGY
jgi:hypothetical protein